MGYYANRHGNNNTPAIGSASQDVVKAPDAPKRSYYRERHLKEIPKSENVMERALPGMSETLGNIFDKVGRALPLTRGMGITALKNPVVQQGMIGAGEAMLFGTPNLMPRYGEFTRPEGSTEQLARTGGQLAMTGVQLGPSVVRGARTIGSGMKGVGKAIGKTASYIPKVFSKKGQVETVEKFGKELSGKRWGTMTKWFGRKVDTLAKANPGKVIDMSEDFAQMGRDAVYDPELAKMIQSNPTVRQLVESPAYAKNMTLGEVQNLKNTVTSSIPEAVKSGAKGSSKYVSKNILVEKINRGIANNFEEMKGVAQEYGKKAEQFKKFSPAFRSKSTESVLGGRGGGRSFLSSIFRPEKHLGGNVAEVALQEFSPRIAEEVAAANRANRLLQAAKVGGASTLAGTLGVKNLIE